jgi:CRISPR-associated endonuclease/helicase Cas3
MEETEEGFVHEQGDGKDSVRALARVFFIPECGRPAQMLGIPLKNHLQNVTRLAQLWSFEHAFGEEQCPPGLRRTRRWLERAAARHDEGKVRRLQIVPDDRHPDRFTYSFAGHRFDVLDDCPYVQWLIKLHHEFSVDGITQAQSWLKQASDRELAEAAECFALDLYALEMCDQIEAGAACRVFGQRSAERVFMEFELVALDGERFPWRFGLFPYPFVEPEVRFMVEAFVVSVPRKGELDGNTLKRYLVGERPIEPTEQKEVCLCPLE